MTIEEAINILIAVAVCSTEYLYCDEHCPFYHPEGVRICNEWNDEMAKEAVETVSDLRQQEHFREVTKKVEPLTNAQKIRAMSDEELVEFLIDLADDGNLRIREWLQQPSGEEDKHEAD